MPTLESVSRLYRESSDTALELADQLERVQVHTPLSELFGRLSSEANSQILSVTLLCLDSYSRTPTLKWLMGEGFVLYDLEIAEQIGLLELTSNDKFLLMGAGSERQEFTGWERLILAVENNGLRTEGKIPRHLELSGKSDRGVDQLHLLLPESPSFVEETPALMTRVLKETNVLMVAGSVQHELQEGERRTIDTLMEGMSCFWPLCSVDEFVDIVAIPEHGWWSAWQPDVVLPPKLVTTQVQASLPTLLTNPLEPLRQAIKYQQLSHRFELACEAMEDFLTLEIRQLTSRRKHEERKGNDAIKDLVGAEQNVWNQSSHQLQDEIARLTERLQERNQRLERPSSQFCQTLKAHFTAIDFADLQQELTSQKTTLILSEKSRQDLIDLLRKQIHRSVDTEKEIIQRHLEDLRERLIRDIERADGTSIDLSLEPIDQEGLLRALDDFVEKKTHCQGEIAEPGFFSRLVESRKKALERTDTELSRVRDEMFNGVRGVIAEINQQKINRQNDFLGEIRRVWQAQIDHEGSKWQAQLEDAAQLRSHQAKTRLRMIDVQIRDWRSQQPPVDRLKHRAERLAQESDQLVKELAAKITV